MTDNIDQDPEEQERIILLAERVKLLFMFCSDMLDDLDLLERVLKESHQRNSMATSGAVILGALGIDSEEAELDAQLHIKRTDALIALITTLRDTEADRTKFKLSKADREATASQLRQFLNI